ncbi:LysM peptidoglycan-binding domain-containing protein [Gleimia sp. 6138-11-ORH1]|uniref:LysM peptidoglycan-binding domain-containing protein n=1 Tax=Gleimia sp. 6138-11-ORH1 TaxID=2973937 RepID=UPI00216A2C58|nr:LysM peptidoglycan-binding domain-containing protein [Gleimia sp. 6138-11-ORH1]MCS4484061.1 LysM peptidoglycan-binding domain-containing protein [Gleimia sp. 6138-11-ORH1]
MWKKTARSITEGVVFDSQHLLLSFRSLISSLLLTCVTVLCLVLLEDLFPALSSLSISATVPANSPLLLLPFLIILVFLSFYSLWLTLSHLAVSLTLILLHCGYEVNFQKFLFFKLLSPAAKKNLHRALASSLLLSTLGSVAQAASPTTDDLRWGNHGTESHVGITIPTSVSSASLSELTSPVTDESATWEVTSGDCLWSIAARHLHTDDVSLINEYWQAIWNANRPAIGDNPNLIYPGQSLILPPLSSKQLERKLP